MAYLDNRDPIYSYVLTFFRSNDQKSHAQKSVGWNYLSIINFNGCTIEVKELISNFIPHFMVDVITYPHWDQS